MSEKLAIYPGTFDPITYGHNDIITRALRIVDHLVIAVAENANKQPLFSQEERVELVQGQIKRLQLEQRISVIAFDGLLVDCARVHGAELIIRGLRAVSDFEYEFQMSGMNARMDADIQTVFLPASENTHFIASRFVKEIARLGGDISEFVSQEVREALKAKFAELG